MVKKKSIAVWAGMTDRAMTYSTVAFNLCMVSLLA